MAQLVEHILGKDEVPSSNLGSSSKKRNTLAIARVFLFSAPPPIDSHRVFAPRAQNPVRSRRAERVELARKRQACAYSPMGENLGNFYTRERVMIYKANALMIYSIFDADDIPQRVADDIHAFRRDFLFLQKYMKNHATHFFTFSKSYKKENCIFYFFFEKYHNHPFRCTKKNFIQQRIYFSFIFT